MWYRDRKTDSRYDLGSISVLQFVTHELVTIEEEGRLRCWGLKKSVVVNLGILYHIGYLLCYYFFIIKGIRMLMEIPLQ